MNLLLDTFYVINVINQIVPTAYILNSGYWPWYSTPSGRSLCVCRRFGLYCPHIRSINHWINMGPLADAAECLYFTTNSIRVVPIECKVNTEVKVSDLHQVYICEIIIVLQVQPEGNPKEQSTLLIETRYMFVPEFSPIPVSVVQFSPQPYENPNYGRYFQCLKNFQNRHANIQEVGLQKLRTYTLVACNIPNYTVILRDTTHPIFKAVPESEFVQNSIQHREFATARKYTTGQGDMQVKLTKNNLADIRRCSGGRGEFYYNLFPNPYSMHIYSDVSNIASYHTTMPAIIKKNVQTSIAKASPPSFCTTDYNQEFPPLPNTTINSSDHFDVARISEEINEQDFSGAIDTKHLALFNNDDYGESIGATTNDCTLINNESVSFSSKSSIRIDLDNME